jgi:nucleotidyltransferase substrate binding protein (TIGR01987 family)
MQAIAASLAESVKRLDEILRQPRTVANRDSAIKRFELTFELAWKSIQRFMSAEGIVCRSPREAFKAAFRYGLIADDERWQAMMEDRNQTVHTYSENLADAVHGRLAGYLELFRALSERIGAALSQPRPPAEGPGAAEARDVR